MNQFTKINLSSAIYESEICFLRDYSDRTGFCFGNGSGIEKKMQGLKTYFLKAEL